MSGPGIKSVEGSSVDAPCHAAHEEGSPPTHWDDILRVTTPIEMGGLDRLSVKGLGGRPKRVGPEGPTLGVRHEVNKLDVGPL